jgi:Uma2 family endonuclease
MSTVMTPQTAAAPAPLVFTGPMAHVPPLEVLRWLTAIPERRVVFRGVDWAFYEELVHSIPEGANIHVDYDGRDLEFMGKGPKHESLKETLGDFVKVVAAVMGIACRAMGETTWERPEIARGLESDQCFYFSRKKLAQQAAARKRDSDDIADYPNPDLAIEVDISRPEVDRAGIYAALRVPEIWRLDGNRVIIERLTPRGTYGEVDSSGFLPVRAEEVRRWVLEEDTSDQTEWAERLRAEMQKKARRLARAARRRGGAE